MKLLAALAFSLASVRAADLLIAAASDLGPFTPALEKAFTGAKIRFSIGSSGSLARQIENGAPFDVFLSASDQYVKNLAASGHLDPATVVVYATGRIGLWSADGSVHSMDDLTKPHVKHIAIPNPEFAPYGVAAKKTLETRGLWKQIEPKIVYAENVRQALQFAESRNADAVITSWTLLKDRGVLLPAEWHDPIRQAGGVVKTSSQPAAALRFLQFLRGSEGRRILESGGCLPHDKRAA
jgi:molybdate transport system substrate-binding protein